MSTETKTYSLAEVAKHNSNKSVWFVIHNNIYDVTEFLNEVSREKVPFRNQTGRLLQVASNFFSVLSSLDVCFRKSYATRTVR